MFKVRSYGIDVDDAIQSMKCIQYNLILKQYLPYNDTTNRGPLIIVGSLLANN